MKGGVILQADTPVDDESSLREIDAARLLTQASFGATQADIARVRELGIEGWIDEQLTLRGTSPGIRARTLQQQR